MNERIEIEERLPAHYDNEERAMGINGQRLDTALQAAVKASAKAALEEAKRRDIEARRFDEFDSAQLLQLAQLLGGLLAKDPYADLFDLVEVELVKRGKGGDEEARDAIANGPFGLEALRSI